MSKKASAKKTGAGKPRVQKSRARKPATPKRGARKAVQKPGAKKATTRKASTKKAAPKPAAKKATASKAVNVKVAPKLSTAKPGTKKATTKSFALKPAAKKGGAEKPGAKKAAPTLIAKKITTPKDIAQKTVPREGAAKIDAQKPAKSLPPSERLLCDGVHGLSDAELLSVLLGGTRGPALSEKLLSRFGTLRNLARAPLKKFRSVPGAWRGDYARLRACLEFARRHLLESLGEKPVLSNPEMARQYLRSHLRDKPRETFLCLYLSNRHALLRCEELFVGTLEGAYIYPREVLKSCLEYNAAAVIFAHNHPSGVAEPSVADQNMTVRLRDALALVDIRLLDHLIVGENEVVSLAEQGVL